MPLLDHFQPPIATTRPWSSFHSRWANSIADELNLQLPDEFTAEVQCNFGSQIEADVAEFHRGAVPQNGDAGVAVKAWAPPKATNVIPWVFPDSFEVQILDQISDARVAGVIELVSPGNKDRPESRQAFAIKTASYLQAGIGVIVVDIVTKRRANLHEEFLRLLQTVAPSEKKTPPLLYAVAYRPGAKETAAEIEIWSEELLIGEALPVLPLALRRGPTVPVDLEATYEAARQRAKL
jgi:hypothetical protein